MARLLTILSVAFACAAGATLAAAEPVRVPDKLDSARIVPLIKDRHWLAGLQRFFKERDATQQPVFDDLNAELAVVYAEDTPKAMRYLSSRENLGVARSELRALAVDNLLRLMPPIEMRQSIDGFFMITSHADYGASLLLVDEIWSGGQIKVDGDIVVAVPAKDVILAGGANHGKSLTAMRATAQKIAKGRYGLVDTLFVYRGGRFQRLDLN